MPQTGTLELPAEIAVSELLSSLMPAPLGRAELLPRLWAVAVVVGCLPRVGQREANRKLLAPRRNSLAAGIAPRPMLNARAAVAALAAQRGTLVAARYWVEPVAVKAVRLTPPTPLRMGVLAAVTPREMAAVVRLELQGIHLQRLARPGLADQAAAGAVLDAVQGRQARAVRVALVREAVAAAHPKTALTVARAGLAVMALLASWGCNK